MSSFVHSGTPFIHSISCFSGVRAGVDRIVRSRVNYLQISVGTCAQAVHRWNRVIRCSELSLHRIRYEHFTYFIFLVASCLPARLAILYFHVRESVPITSILLMKRVNLCIVVSAIHYPIGFHSRTYLRIDYRYTGIQPLRSAADIRVFAIHA